MKDNFAETAHEVRNRIRNLENNKKTMAKNNLKDKATTSIKTVMIGALSDIEKKMGHLWGHGSENRTPEQQKMYEQWQELRTSILDRGNKSLKILVQNIDRCEISNYDNKYHVTFKK